MRLPSRDSSVLQTSSRSVARFVDQERKTRAKFLWTPFNLSARLGQMLDGHAGRPRPPAGLSPSRETGRGCRSAVSAFIT